MEPSKKEEGEHKNQEEEFHDLPPAEEVEPRFDELQEKPDEPKEIKVDIPADEPEFQINESDLAYLKSDKSWVDVGVPEKLIKNLEIAGFLNPSQIQGTTLPFSLKRKPPVTLMAQSKNGSGKTLCFAIPAVVCIDEKIPYKNNESLLSPQSIIIVPTFELVLQVYNVINKKLLKSSFPDLKVEKVVELNKDKVYDGGHLLIGTVKSIQAQLRLKRMNFDQLKMLAVDEADSIFTNEMDFPEFEKILFKLKENTSLLMFSATFPEKAIQKITALKRKNFTKLTVGKKEDLTLQNVHQYFYDITNDEQGLNQADRVAKKNQLIGQIFRVVIKRQSIIFVNSKKYAEALMYYLRDTEKHSVGLLMGFPMSKEEREFVMRQFTDKKFEILITTNLLSRGIDMREVNIIVNADLPEVYETKLPDYDTYLHRIGRTGRFGDFGIAVNLVDGPKTRNLIESFKKYYSCEIEQLKDLKQLPLKLDKLQEENKKKQEIYGEKTGN